MALLQSISSFSSRACYPRFANNDPLRAAAPVALFAQGRLMAITDELLVEISRPDSQLAAGLVTPVGAAKLRKDLAVRALARLRSEVGEKVAQLEGDVRAATAALADTVRKGLAALALFEIEQAGRTADWFTSPTASLPDREQFVADLRAGVRDAVLAGLLLSSYGSRGLVEVARERFGDSLFTPERRGEVRRLQIAARVLRMQFDDAEASYVYLTDKGTDPTANTRELMDRSNDASLAKLLDEAERLHVVEPRTASTGEASKGAADASLAMFQRANGAGSAA